MFSKTTAAIWIQVFSSNMLKEIVCDGLLSGLLSPWRVYLVPILALLVWRLWRFTVIPWLRPDEPKELPYWIPCKCPRMDALFYE